MINLKQAKSRQRQLQKQADELLESLDLEQELSEFGELKTTGSYAYGLMVYGDIDLEVEADSFDFDQIIDFASQKIKESNIWDASIRDYSISEIFEAESKYVKLRAVVDEEVWKVDIWFLEPDQQVQTPENGMEEGWFENTTEEERNAMLLLKARLWGKRHYIHGGIGSFHVYRAVLEGVRTLDEFKSWMKENYGYYPE